MGGQTCPDRCGWWNGYMGAACTGDPILAPSRPRDFTCPCVGLIGVGLRNHAMFPVDSQVVVGRSCRSDPHAVVPGLSA